jgi:transposase
MSLDKFITDMLNINAEDLEFLDSTKKPDGTMLITLRLKPKPIVCPYCKGAVKIHGYYSRKLVHSALVGRKCVLIYQQRRYKCDSCELTFHEPNPFINTKENLTYETKINVLKDLKYPEATYTSVARRYNLSATKVQRIFDRHVSIPRKHLPAVLSMDEHYFPESNYSSLYCCLLMDFLTGELIDVLPDRKKPYVMDYLSNIKKDTLDDSTHTSELDNVKYLSIDLYDNFRDLAKTYFPSAIICADSFHVLQHLTDAFRKIRIRCRKDTEDPAVNYLLAKFKFVFHHDTFLDNEAKYNKSLGQYINYRGIRDLLFLQFPLLQQAYELKEYYINFNSSATKDNSADGLEAAIHKFEEYDIPEYREFKNLLINWHDEILNSFTIVENRRINNSYIESKNRLLAKLIDNANGFTNFTRARKRILYCFNKNDTFHI